MKRRFIFVFSFLMIFAFVERGSTNSGTIQVASGNSLSLKSSAPNAKMDFGKMPVYFIANRGQMDERVAYYVQGKDKNLYFTSEGMTITLSGRAKDKAGASVPLAPNRGDREGKKIGVESDSRWVVKLDFVGANPKARPVGVEKTGAVISYFRGKPEEWKTGLPAYSKIAYKDLWPGIDLLYYGTVDRMKYEFTVHPGADPSLIRLAYRGAEKVNVTEEGRLAVTTPVGGFEDDVPVAWQEVEGKRASVAAAYVLGGPQETEEETPENSRYECGFQFGEYDHSRPLIIDPEVLIYCGYIGGSSEDRGYGIAVDISGNAYITGSTDSTQASFPIVVGPDLTFNGALSDAFVAKVNASGTSLIYCGYIGGAANDYATDIAVDDSGNAYIVGVTGSASFHNFPVVVGPDLSYNLGDNDAFVAKVNASGTSLIYCGYIGGEGSDSASGIAVDGSGNAYITGSTDTFYPGFPVLYGPDLTSNGRVDAFVAKVNASGTALSYCGWIGGSDQDFGSGIAVDGSGNAYVTGWTFSTEASFPVVSGPALTHNGLGDAFVAKVNASGTALSYCGYIGGSSQDEGHGIAVDSSGNATITGYTESTEASFPVVSGPDLTYNGLGDAFVAKVNASGTALSYCGYLGGAGSDISYGGIAVDGFGNASIAGVTYSSEATFPVVSGPDLTMNGEGGDAFVAKVNASGTALIYCGYIGGISYDCARDIAMDSFGNAYVTGYTQSDQSTFPDTVGPDLTFNGGSFDAFVAKIAYSPIVPTITITSPNGGESWLAGSTHNITWTSTGAGGNVKIEYSTDNGASYNAVIASTENDGIHVWTIPNTLSALCLIRISEAEWGTPSDVSDAVFAIVAPPAISLSLTSLYFSAAAGGAQPADQKFYITNGGGGTLAWTVSEAAGWLICAPASGSGNAVITVSANAAGLAAGNYQAVITVSSTNAANSPQTIAVTLSIRGTGTTTGWNTFLGGSNSDLGHGIAVDTSGNVYVAGESWETWGSPVSPFSGPASDVFVAKLNNSGDLQWNTFLGGSSKDFGRAITVDTSGNVYVAGYSEGTWGSPIRPFSGSSGTPDAFVAKLNNSGVLQWNTFLGGSSKDFGRAITVDTSGNVYVAGESWATWGSPVRPYSGSEYSDAFAAKLNGSGALQWNTFLGGSDHESGYGIAVDTNGNVCVTGHSDWTWGSPVRPFNSSGMMDAFVAKLNGSGALQWNTFLGGSSDDFSLGIAVDTSGNVYATGESGATWSSPVRPFDSSGFDDTFVAKLNGNGTLQWNTFLGGSNYDWGYGIAVDTSGSVYAAGWSGSTWGSPVRPFDSSGCDDTFVAKLNGNGTLQWNTFLGGSNYDWGYGIAVDTSGSVYVTGASAETWGSPVRPFDNLWDAFVAKVNVPTINATSPNGGESWAVGSAHNITWTTTGTIANVKIEYSTDSGTNWTTIIASTANTGSYTWTVPNTPSTNCLVRVSDAANAGTNDVSDAVFAISTIPAVISLSHTRLNYGVITGDVAIQAQSVSISNTGGGTLNWTAASDQTWLGVTLASGSGAAVVQISVNPTGLAAKLTAGAYQGTITVTDPSASNSPQTITVNLIVYAAGTSTVPFGYFETPLDGTKNITGAIPVTGWVVDDIEVTRVEILRENVAGETPGLWAIGDAGFVEGARPDIETALPGYPMNYKAGWGYMMLTNMLPGQGNGTVKLYAYATDKEGNRVLLGTKTITCDNAHAVKPFGTIDSPEQGGNASGNPYLNFGWVLTPLTKTVPKNGSTILVYVDGAYVGNLGTAPNVYDQYRVDVSTAFPGLNNTGAPGAGGPVGAYFLDTTKYPNGVHTIAWVATDDGGAADGIGSRYFNIMNTGASANGIKDEGSTIAPDFAAAVPKMGTLGRLPVSFDSVSVKKGFDLSAPAEMIEPDRYGVIRTEMREVERLELDLGKGPGLKGYLVVGEELRGLPIGSTLDTKKGTFSWLPGPGFLGTYNLLFVQEDEVGIRRRIPVVVTIKPKFRTK